MSDTLQSPGPPGRKPPWYRRTWFVATVTGVVALLVGAGAGVTGTTDVTSTPEYQALAGDLESAQQNLEDTRSELENVRSTLQDTQTKLEKVQGNLPEREAAVKKARNQLDRRENQLDQRERRLEKAKKELRQREKKVGLIEQKIERNTIPGDGIFAVGEDMRPGTYKSAGSAACYYAVLNSPNTFDIAMNNNTSGPAIVQLSQGQFFETQGCAEWVLQP